MMTGHFSVLDEGSNGLAIAWGLAGRVADVHVLAVDAPVGGLALLHRPPATRVA